MVKEKQGGETATKAVDVVKKNTTSERGGCRLQRRCVAGGEHEDRDSGLWPLFALESSKVWDASPSSTALCARSLRFPSPRLHPLLQPRRAAPQLSELGLVWIAHCAWLPEQTPAWRLPVLCLLWTLNTRLDQARAATAGPWKLSAWVQDQVAWW